jgi:hypothetical protein
MWRAPPGWSVWLNLSAVGAAAADSGRANAAAMPAVIRLRVMNVLRFMMIPPGW